MTDQGLVIELEPDDTQGHVKVRVTDDEGWLTDRLRRDPGATRVTLKASDDDVEGHAGGTAVALRAFEDDDDTEGHAIAVHFPSRQEADAFRKRLMLTGVIVGAVALGAAAGVGLDSIQSESGVTTVGAAGTSGADRDAGLMDFGAAAAAPSGPATVTDSDRDAGLMDMGAAAAAGDAAASGVTDADRDIGLMDLGSTGAAETDDNGARRNLGPTPE
jgi:hypothetical protein